MDAINSTNGELNVPLEVYATKTPNTADTAAQDSARVSSTASKSDANAGSGQTGSTLVPNAQLRNQLQNQERLRALETRAEEAAQRARARIAEKHGQTQQSAPAPAPEQSQDSAN